MNSIHQAFLSRPAFCKLDDFFYLLDQFDGQDRHTVLAAVYPEAFKTVNIRTPEGVKTPEQVHEYCYNRFKDWCRELVTNRVVTTSFLVTGILSYCLAWCCRGSDEKVIPELVVHNEKEKRDAIKAHKKGEISKDELDRQLEEWDRKIEGHKADVERMKRLYTSFCENVLDRLPRDSP